MMAKQRDPVPDPAAEGGAPDPEAQRVQSLDERFRKIEQAQAEQGGMLEKILDRLPGGDAKPDPTAGPVADAANGPTSPPASDIQATVRREIEEAKARQEAENRAKNEADWRKSVDETLEALKPEKAPREPQTGLRGRLQRLTVGKPD
jgi:hypothetical protein